MATLENVFSWSISRDANFRRCPRQYFFTYYGSWGGWERGANQRTRALYVLKQLRGRKAWAGENVHNAIRYSLSAIRDGGSLFSPESVVEQTLQNMRSAWRDSGEGLYWENPKKYCALWEHELDIEIPDEEWKATVDHALNCLKTFFASETFQMIASLPRDDWLELEDLSSFDLNGTKIWVQLDFAHRDGDGIAIYDWKTGRADRETTRQQLACYILYAAQRWRIAPEKIIAREYNLAANSLHETRLTAEEIPALIESLNASANELARLHGCDEESFPLAADEAACKSCNFLRVCPRWLNDLDGGAE